MFNLKTVDSSDPNVISDIVRGEHPQIISIVLVYLEKEQALKVLELLPEKIRADVVMRIATMDSINSSALSELDAILEQRFSGASGMPVAAPKVTNVGDVRNAAELLNGLKNDSSSSVIEKITESNIELSTEIQDQIFIFENLMELDDHGMQTLLRDISSDDLVISLKGSSQKMKEKIFHNMSSCAAEMMRDDLESRGPVRLKEVEDVQKNILTIARTLSDEGKIMLGDTGENFV